MEDHGERITLEAKLEAMEKLMAFLLALDPQKELVLRKGIESEALTFFDSENPPGKTPADAIKSSDMLTVFQRVLRYSEKWQSFEILRNVTNKLEGPPYQDRIQEFGESLQNWGYVFMLTVWTQSVMASAVAKKTGRDKPENLFDTNMKGTWTNFRKYFSGSVTAEEALTADMIILIRNQMAHCHISSGRENTLFLPNETSKPLLEKLKEAGWVLASPEAHEPEMLVMREGDTEWFERNTAMILHFSENTILRRTRLHGIADSAIC